MNKTKLAELRRSAEYELAPYDEKCPECDFPKSYRHRYGCEFPYFKKDPAAILELLNTLDKAVGVIKFYANTLNYTHLKGTQADENPWGRPVISFDDLSPVEPCSEWGTYGGKRAREFLASMEGKE